MRHWLGQSPEEIHSVLHDLGAPAFRSKQLVNWLHTNRVESWDEMKNLPATLRTALGEQGLLRAFTVRERRDATDGLTEKWLLEKPGDDRDRELVECVLIIEKRRTRRTACVSSMIGCPLDCLFCATGKLGFVRNLSAGEIVEQAYRIDARLKEKGENGLSHIVYMGMGEPLLNLDAVLASARIFHGDFGLGLSGRHLTISTVGIPDGLRKLSASGIVHRLAVSLHAPNQRIREELLPAARRWPLDKLLPALEGYAASAARDITFEYCLVDGVNSSPKDAKELSRLVSPFRCLVNLIPLNPVPGVPLKPPPAEAIRRFQESLEQSGVAATVRMEKGAEIGAACGQLRAEAQSKNGRNKGTG